jgi:hypothetical protein
LAGQECASVIAYLVAVSLTNWPIIRRIVCRLAALSTHFLPWRTIRTSWKKLSKCAKSKGKWSADLQNMTRFLRQIGSYLTVELSLAATWQSMVSLEKRE